MNIGTIKHTDGNTSTVIYNKTESVQLFIHMTTWHWIRYIPSNGGLGMNEFTFGPFRLIWF